MTASHDPTEQDTLDIDGDHLWTLSLREQWDVAPGGWGGVNGDSATELFLSGERP